MEQDTAPLFWAWAHESMRIKTFRAAAITDSAIYYQTFKTTGGVKELVKQLQSGQSPQDAFGKSAQVIALEDMRSFTLSQANSQLRLSHRASSGEDHELVIHAPEDDIYKQVFAVLHEKLGTGAEPRPVPLPVGQSIKAPLIGLVLTVLVGAAMIFLALGAESDYDAVGRKARQKELLNDILLTLGPVGTSAIAGLIAAGFIGWIVYRMKNPPVAYQVDVQR